MSDAAIRVEGLSKRYRIGHKEQMYETLAGALRDFVGRPARNLRRLRRLARFSGADEAQRDIVWALKDVSFEVRPGEVIGVIGENGAGKTTLLKILSRITEPTHGRAVVRGRVSSLLEVGTGFHPELTGRENVYLNGTILGMTKAEIDRKFDEIVDFSGVEEFLDTPIKRFSSGMQVRLAFSVAAHLEPEILLVDEVLAVGDAHFQKKCLGKMRDVTEQGRTVLLVSHNMSAIRNLCERVILLEHGRLVMDGKAESVIARHLRLDVEQGGAIATRDDLVRKARRSRWGDTPREVVHCREVRLLGPDGRPRNRFRSDEAITLAMIYECLEKHNDFRIIVSVVDDEGRPILATQNADDPESAAFYQLRPGLYRSEITFPPNLFGERRFHLSVSLVLPHVDRLDLERVLSFDVTFNGYNNIQYLNQKDSFLRPKLRWTMKSLESEVGVGTNG